jgi:hypothetical protein
VGRTAAETAAAGADDVDFAVRGVNPGFHFLLDPFDGLLNSQFSTRTAAGG